MVRMWRSIQRMVWFTCGAIKMLQLRFSTISRTNIFPCILSQSRAKISYSLSQSAIQSKHISGFQLSVNLFLKFHLKYGALNQKPLEPLIFLTWKLSLTTVLIFFFPSVALRRHLLSAGSKLSTWPLRGTGFVRPSSVLKKNFYSYSIKINRCLLMWDVKNCSWADP